MRIRILVILALVFVLSCDTVKLQVLRTTKDVKKISNVELLEYWQAGKFSRDEYEAIKFLKDSLGCESAKWLIKHYEESSSDETRAQPSDLIMQGLKHTIKRFENREEYSGGVKYKEYLNKYRAGIK